MKSWIIALAVWRVWSGGAVQAAIFWEETFENHLYPNWDGGGGCITAGSPDGVACDYPQITTSTSYNGTHSLWCIILVHVGMIALKASGGGGGGSTPRKLLLMGVGQ